MKKYIFFLSSLLIASLFITSCSSSDDDELMGNWKGAADFGGTIRSDATLFTIGDSVYVCCGHNPNSTAKWLKDTWVFDITRNIWSQRSDFAGIARSGAVGFSANDNGTTKGYVGTGYNDLVYLKDFYSFDPTRNKWEAIAPFKGPARSNAVAFNTANYGYVGTGFNDVENYLSDFWKYVPANDDWVQVNSLGGKKRTQAVTFTIGNTSYVCCGLNSSGYVNDFWAFDTSSETWTEKRKIANVSTESYDDDYGNRIVRAGAVAFIIDNKAYVTTGEAGSATSSTWRYEPTTDLWYEVTAFEGLPRTGAVGFTVKNRGFLATGKATGRGQVTDDMWEFFPYEERVNND